MQTKTVETIVLGGGCFWCTEAVFKGLRGVIAVTPGYAGGIVDNPTYYDVSSGETGHAEVIKVEFDPLEITLDQLLDVFFHTHDPTTLNQQGADTGTQYRSIILYTNESQKKNIEDFIARIESAKELPDSVVTEVKGLTSFYQAEQEHLDYYKNNPDKQYCAVVITPKLKKFQERYRSLLK